MRSFRPLVMTDGTDLESIRARNLHRIETYRHACVGDEVHLSGWYGDDNTDDRDVQGIVTATRAAPERSGFEVTIDGKIYHPSDYVDRYIVEFTAKQDIDYLIHIVMSQAAELDEARALTARVHAEREKHDLAICRNSGCLTLGITGRILGLDETAT